MASDWVNNTVITDLADLGDFLNYREIKKALNIVLFCNENTPKIRAVVGRSSQSGLYKTEMAFCWQSWTCSTAPLGSAFSERVTIWVQSGTVSTPGGAGSCKRDGNIHCCVGRSLASSMGKAFSPRAGADCKTCLLPQFPCWEVTGTTERQLYPAEYSVFLLRLPTSIVVVFCFSRESFAEITTPHVSVWGTSVCLMLRRVQRRFFSVSIPPFLPGFCSLTLLSKAVFNRKLRSELLLYWTSTFQGSLAPEKGHQVEYSSIFYSSVTSW